MTLLGFLGFQPQKRKEMLAPSCISSMDISIVIPVKDNQKGVINFLSEFRRTHPPTLYPKEIILVDNNSHPPIVIPQELALAQPKITLLRCLRPGPACARNLGIQCACSNWILFTDSDCIPSSSFLSGYFTAMNGSVGYAGSVKAWGKDIWSQYYESQETLIPPPAQEDGKIRPAYLITANALVWRPALEEIGGFNETIEIAAGEDIDLGFRLREIGSLSYATMACVFHNFDDGLFGFIRRFIRYGKGNRRLSQLYSLDFTPCIFSARKPSAFNWLLSKIQYVCLSLGYRTAEG